MEEPRKCSKCDGDLDTEGYPKWCKECRNKYRRDYNALVKDMSETRGFAAGIAFSCSLLAGLPPGAAFDGPSAAAWIKERVGKSNAVRN